jgi:Leucine-rich repeat (LRR) protein
MIIKNYNLDEVLTLPPQLEVLTVVGSKYRNILPDVLPSSLIALNLYNVYATYLPELPSSLAVLRCHNEPLGPGLTSLPALPESLKILDVQGNSITKLGKMPSKLERLNCDQNDFDWLL